MDEYSFQSELKNYKVIRRADFHKVYWNKKYQVYNTKNSNDYFYYTILYRNIGNPKFTGSAFK